MSGFHKLGTLLIATAVTIWALCAGAQTANVASGDQVQTSIQQVAVPSTPADMPPSPPKVTCAGDKLTISAKNSTLASVLSAVRGCTGADIDVPEGAAAERIFAEFGPGPVRAVLAAFLSQTDLNYVIGASPSDEQKVQTVLLSSRGNDKSATKTLEGAVSNPNLSTTKRAWLETRQSYLQSFSSNSNESAQTNEPTPSSPASAAAPAAIADADVNSVPAASTPADSQSSTKTEIASTATTSAEQNENKAQPMIDNMRALFEQRKQMVQQQAGTKAP